MNIKVLGTGCKKCKALEVNVNEAVSELGIQAQNEKVEDIPTIMKYGVMSTPALVVDEKVFLSTMNWFLRKVGEVSHLVIL